MEASLKIDVAALDDPHRRALEEVIGLELALNQQLVISVIDSGAPASDATRPAQSLDDWTRVYEGLSDQQIQCIDQIAKQRANLTRNVP